MAKRRYLLPWWLEVGTEICPDCHHLYSYETEYRCKNCDGPVCSTCLEPTQKVCKTCAADEESSIDIEINI